MPGSTEYFVCLHCDDDAVIHLDTEHDECDQTVKTYVCEACGADYYVVIPDDECESSSDSDS